MADDGKEADSGEDARMSSDTGGCEVAQVVCFQLYWMCC